MNYQRILERFINTLNCEIANKTDNFHLSFLSAQYTKGNMTDEDCAEIKGYYNGLKVAREMLERIIATEYLEEDEVSVEILCNNLSNKDIATLMLYAKRRLGADLNLNEKNRKKAPNNKDLDEKHEKLTRLYKMAKEIRKEFMNKGE